MGCCAFALVLAGAPRLATLVWWFVQPARMGATFSGWLLPLLGIVFLPWTTLMYIIVFPGGLTLVNWVFLGLALAVDIGSYGSGYRANSQRG